MVESELIVKCISRDKKTAYHRARKNGGAYIVRGNSIIKTNSGGEIHIVKNLPQLKVRVKEGEKVIVLK